MLKKGKSVVVCDWGAGSRVPSALSLISGMRLTPLSKKGVAITLLSQFGASTCFLLKCCLAMEDDPSVGILIPLF